MPLIADNHRLARVFGRGQHLKRRDQEAARFLRIEIEAADVGAGAEGLVAAAGDDGDPDGVVRIGLFQAFENPGADAGVQRIELARLIEREDRYLAPGFVINAAQSHGALPFVCCFFSG